MHFCEDVSAARRSVFAIASALICLLAALPVHAEKPGRHADAGQIVVGFEYALLDNATLVDSMASTFAETGVPGMKHYVEIVQWDKMQKGPGKPIDFRRLDWFVGKYQEHGFTDLTVSLKSHSRWGSKDTGLFGGKNPTPKPEYEDLYADWVAAVVERYDGDGVDDMPGLRWPVRYYEIGNEFSSYEPEPVDEYLDMLAIAYESAHSAFDDVLITHAAFLTTPVNLDVADPPDYDAVWRNTQRHDQHHDLADMRAILDRPDLFDVINLHNLGDPYEIEDQIRWLDYETGQRGYVKPVIISDTLATSYVGWGSGTRCKGKNLGVLARPATEADRCDLANYFTKLVNKDADTLAWTRGFVAADHVQRVVVAADQSIDVINLAFVADIPFLTWKTFQAGAGISAWGGALDITMRGKVKQRYPLFHAIGQLMMQIDGYTSIDRVSLDNEQVRFYRIDRPDGIRWMAWLDPGRVILPDRPSPKQIVTLPVPGTHAVIEPVITRVGQTEAASFVLPLADDNLEIELSHTPIFINANQE